MQLIPANVTEGQRSHKKGNSAWESGFKELYWRNYNF